MTKGKKLATAALAGLLGVGVATAGAAFANDHGEKASCKSKSGCKGKAAVEKANCKTADGKEKHACKGLNSCKGQGADGKNECKGHGSCATDGSHE